ncbi:MAG: hypothetical protein IPP47_27120 [Bryobacterales bacterium]|nr:hypothetical protein [Bryobacterales bacterium]
MKRLIFWDFPRAGWQYDIAVAAILAFIFLTPRELFKDQPRPASIVQMPSDTGGSVYWLETSLLESTPEGGRPQRAAELLKARTGKPANVVKVEPIHDAELEVRGFMAIVKP